MAEGNHNIADLVEKVYTITRMIPVGRVTTYGAPQFSVMVLKLAGYPNYARHVGNAMKALPPNTDIPWQRVISSAGLISPRGDSGLGVARQRERLEAEGVIVVTLAGSGGEKVSLAEYGWFPETLEW